MPNGYLKMCIEIEKRSRNYRVIIVFRCYDFAQKKIVLNVISLEPAFAIKFLGNLHYTRLLISSASFKSVLYLDFTYFIFKKVNRSNRIFCYY